MKKTILSVLVLLMLSVPSFAATTYFAVATGNWSGTTTWSLSSGGATQASFPIAGDTAIFDSNTGAHTVTISGAAACATLNMTGSNGTLAWGTQTLTVSAGATLSGAMTASTGTLTVTGGGVTLAATPTGSFPTIKLTTAAQPLTSGGFTWPGAVNFDFAGIYTLSGNWITSGLTTFTLASNINKTAAETYTANGGTTMVASSGTTSTAGYIFGGGTAAFSTFTLTMLGPVTVGGAMTSTSGTLTTGAGGVTLSSTPTGTFPTLKVGASSTMTSGGFTWPGNLTINGTNTSVLNGSWIVTGLTTFSGGVITLNWTTNETLTMNGGLTTGAGVTNGAGTAGLILGGGTWTTSTSADIVQNNFTIAGNCTINNIYYKTGTFTYSSGTVSGTPNLFLVGSATLNTSGLTWNQLQVSTAATITMTSNINTTNWNILAATNTFVGAFNLTTVNMYLIGGSTALVLTFPASQTITVTGILSLANSNAITTYTIKPPSSTPFNLTYSGTVSNSIVAGVTFTNVNATSSAQAIADYGVSNAALSGSSNVVAYTQNNFNPVVVNNFTNMTVRSGGSIVVR